MRIFREELRHKAQASGVRLSVFEQPGGGFLATEDRLGTATVVVTLGLFDDRESALARARTRADELKRQRYTVVAG